MRPLAEGLRFCDKSACLKVQTSYQNTCYARDYLSDLCGFSGAAATKPEKLGLSPESACLKVQGACLKVQRWLKVRV